MIYKISYTRTAINELTGIVEYITYKLCNKKAAKDLVNKITKSIDLLSIAPFMHKLYDIDPWDKMNMHIYSVNNYAIVYVINLEKEEVIITHIVNSKMDINEQLKKK